MSRITDLKVSFKNFQLHIPDWELADEGITVLWGPSGSGKTTVFRALIGLEDCRGMKWEVGGVDLNQLPVSQRNLGVVFQSLELFPHLTAEKNVQFACQARKINGPECSARMAELRDQLQLSSCWQTPASRLSGGEQQRVALARALIGRPRWLLLDEPFSSLDPELRAQARQLLKKVVASQKVPALVISHDAQDRDELADVVVRISKGSLITATE